MTDELKPALTREEWAAGMWIFGDYYGSVRVWKSAEGCGEVERPHAVAALLLRGQPFGFTREDVYLCNRAAETVVHLADEYNLQSLAARIASLLPPEGA